MKGYFKFGSPIIKISLEGEEIPFLLDTGFNGHTMLPFSIIKKLKLKQIGFSDYITATGDYQTTQVYLCKILFFDKEIDIPVLSTSTEFTLAGMGLFHDCRLVIERSKNIVEVTQEN